MQMAQIFSGVTSTTKNSPDPEGNASDGGSTLPNESSNGGAEGSTSGGVELGSPSREHKRFSFFSIETILCGGGTWFVDI